MSLNREKVAHIARLARIEMDTDKLEAYVPQLNTIMDWVEQLGEVDTDDVTPLANVADIKPEMRRDEVTDGDKQKDILANAPETMEGFFVVQKIIE